MSVIQDVVYVAKGAEKLWQGVKSVFKKKNSKDSPAAKKGVAKASVRPLSAKGNLLGAGATVRSAIADERERLTALMPPAVGVDGVGDPVADRAASGGTISFNDDGNNGLYYLVGGLIAAGVVYFTYTK